MVLSSSPEASGCNLVDHWQLLILIYVVFNQNQYIRLNLINIPWYILNYCVHVHYWRRTMYGSRSFGLKGIIYCLSTVYGQYCLKCTTSISSGTYKRIFIHSILYYLYTVEKVRLKKITTECLETFMPTLKNRM